MSEWSLVPRVGELTIAVTVVGTFASLAARLMGVVSQKLTDAFFDCVRKKIEH